MKKKNLLYMYVINCLPLLFCIVGFIGGALFDFLCMPVLQLVLTGLNFRYSSNWGWLFLSEIHMWIMSIAVIAKLIYTGYILACQKKNRQACLSYDRMTASKETNLRF